ATAPGGAFNVHASDDSELVVDVAGYFVPTGGLYFHPIRPCRVADTRLSGGPLNGARDFVVGGPCLLQSNARAYTLNVTAVPQGPPSYITAWAAGPARPPPTTPNTRARPGT